MSGDPKPSPGALGATQLFNLSFGAVIGVGWIVVIGGWLRDAGPAGGALAFAVASVFMLMIARAYAALAVAFPVGGGELTYARAAFGPTCGYWVGWCLALAYIVVIAFEMVSLPWILRELVGMAPAATGQTDLIGVGLGLAALLAVLAASAAGTAFVARAQDIAVGLKILVSLLLIVGGIIAVRPANLTPYWGSHPSGPLAGFLSVFATAPFFLTGFGTVAQAMGESRSPATIRAMPRVMTAVVVGTGLFYALVIFSSGGAMPRSALLGASLPAAAAFTHAFHHPLAGAAVLAVGLLGVLTILNSVFFAAVRLIGAILTSYAEPAPVSGRRANRIGLGVAGLAVALSTAGQASLGAFLNVAAAASAAVMGMVCMTLFVVRRRSGEGNLAGPLGGALLAAIMAFVPVYESVRAGLLSLEPLILGGWTMAGLILWRVLRHRADRAARRHQS